MYKKWILKFLIYGITFCILFAGFNFSIDPYGVFGQENRLSKTKNHIASDRMTKFYYIKREKPRTILIGTSRIGVINPKYVEKYTKDKVYNLSLDASSIEEQYEYIKFLVNKTNTKNIIWGIDFFSFNPDSKLPFAFSQKRLNEDLYINDYRDSLFTMDALFASFLTLKDNIENKQNKVNFKTGQNLFLEHKQGFKAQGLTFIDKKIEEGLEGYKKTKELYGSKNFKYPVKIDKKFIYIKEIINLCKKKNINLKIYISPIYIKTLNLIYELNLFKTYKYFQSNLAEITSFWDFNQNLQITLNKENFWDNSHVKEGVGNLIIDTIYKSSIYGNFITYKNVSKHLEKIEKIAKLND